MDIQNRGQILLNSSSQTLKKKKFMKYQNVISLVLLIKSCSTEDDTWLYRLEGQNALKAVNIKTGSWK